MSDIWFSMTRVAKKAKKILGRNNALAPRYEPRIAFPRPSSLSSLGGILELFSSFAPLYQL